MTYKRPIMLKVYRVATTLIAPILPLYLSRREARGKEDKLRKGERFGYASAPRPYGTLLWIHAASVGEANSVLPMIEAITHVPSPVNILLTTGTVTSAKLMADRLPKGVIHQYVPVDTPSAVKRFFDYWRPDAALWVESELWPNLVSRAKATGCRAYLINARMSERSFKSWQRRKSMIRYLLSCFETVFAQSEADGARYKVLGARQVECLGNLKYDGAPLPADAETLITIQQRVGNRPAWLAASIHPGEDEEIAIAHSILRQRYPNMLTVVVPRHPDKGELMQQLFATHGINAVRRTEGPLLPDTEIYIADTLGELGLFYRAFPIAFIGGSLIPHGGQNPLEPSRLGCAILLGPHHFNFQDITEGLLNAAAALDVWDAESLAERILWLMDKLEGPARVAGMSARASAWVLGRSGVNEKLVERLLPLIAERPLHAA